MPANMHIQIRIQKHALTLVCIDARTTAHTVADSMLYTYYVRKYQSTQTFTYTCLLEDICVHQFMYVRRSVYVQIGFLDNPHDAYFINLLLASQPFGSSQSCRLVLQSSLLRDSTFCSDWLETSALVRPLLL